jgi:hypothetical protein
MLPYFFRHYDDLVDKYFVYDNGSTDGSLAILEKHERVEIAPFEVPGDSFCDEERRLGDTIWQGSDADWVIVTDIDEHIHHPDLLGYLGQCAEVGVTAIESIGYEMVADAFPTQANRLVDTVVLGLRSIGHDRLCIFNPRQISATNFGIGRHQAFPAGRVVWPEHPDVLLLHYKQLGVEYLTARSAELRLGLRALDLERQWGVHYTWSAEAIRAQWRQLRAASGPVPGLGELRHVSPAEYFHDDRVVRQSGLFDADWYLRSYPDVREARIAPFAHYCVYGWKESRSPNFYFDPAWYCSRDPRLWDAGRNPLCDYIESGEKNGASPSPYFDPEWYRAQHGLGPEQSPLRDYLSRRLTGLVSPNPRFDAIAYCERNPEVLAAGKDPFEDYCRRSEQAG